MDRRVWTGIAAGLLAAALLLTVGLGAYRAGKDDNDKVSTQVVKETGESGGGQVVHVVRDGRYWGPGPGFFLFPLFIIVLIIFLARGRWHRHYGYYGHFGPGRYRPGYWGDDPENQWSDWHRRQHEGGEPAPPTPDEA